MIRFLQDQDSLDDKFFFRAFVNTPKYSSIPKVTRAIEQVRKNPLFRAHGKQLYCNIHRVVSPSMFCFKTILTASRIWSDCIQHDYHGMAVFWEDSSSREVRLGGGSSGGMKLEHAVPSLRAVNQNQVEWGWQATRAPLFFTLIKLRKGR